MCGFLSWKSHLAICLRLMMPHWNFSGKKVLLTSVDALDEAGGVAVSVVGCQVAPGVGLEELVGHRV